mmetsp:Transcript_29243/g.53364  ORF Transcript_29243/g.53364 Transcript_29243/m.53364 type:complete len:241 (-) Transcript_29243:36-758(-)
MAPKASSGSSRVYLDVDIDGELEAFELGKAFVEANDIKYGLSSKDVLKLGGSELSRLPEYFEADFQWSAKGKAQFRPPVQRVIIELDEQASPLACQNFKAFCTGEKGKSKESGRMMHYQGVPFHRIVKGMFMQGGDFVKGTGAGGESIFGKSFKDDAGGLKKKHDTAGVVSMSNTGKNSNTCQFFITFKPLPKLDREHVVMGKVVEGMEVIQRVEEECATEQDGTKPKLPVTIVGCGLLT